VNPALPAGPDPDEPVGYDVGAFEQGSPISRWALARYLVGRAIGESVSRSLLIVALVVLVLAGLIEWRLGATFWAVLVALVALGVLAMRAILRAVLRRLSAADQMGPIQARLHALVDDTKSDVLAELRRTGLPGHTWTLPLLPLRFLGRERRRRTVARLRTFDVDRVVPKARVDELHLILRDTIGR
jgi:hypothetical protein